MNKKYLVYIFFLAVLPISQILGTTLNSRYPQSQQDRDKGNQILYNGKDWRNLYTAVKGDQFLFSKEFLPGSVTINGKSFNDLTINYDIYNDEVISPTNHSNILQLNKEMVDSFSLVFQFKTYRFLNTQDDSLNGLKGYVNVLYKGKSNLYIKYKKEIQLLAVDDKYDLFYRTYHIYFVRGKEVHQLSTKNDLMKLLENEKPRIKDFMKKNKLKISKKSPESFIPVLRYYDSLSK